MKKPVIVLLHIGYWSVYLLLLVMIFTGLRFRITPKPSLCEVFLTNPMGIMSIVPNVFAFYGFYIWVFPSFLKKQRIIPLLLSSMVVAISSAAIGCLALYFAHDNLRKLFYMEDEIKLFMVWMSLVALVHGTVALVIRGFIAWYEELKNKAALTQKNFETELALVKSQINPHFLFNTINNIDVLISKDAVKASTYLNKLSDIMRFMLYETKSEKIPLSKELDYVARYVELQKIRTAVPDYVNYHSNIQTEDIQIAPMLFIPFVENAFKHAEYALKTSNSIYIRVEASPNNVLFNCINKYQPGAPVSVEHSGLGDELIRKRLELLYPKKHSLTIEKSADTYSVKLLIDWHDN